MRIVLDTASLLSQVAQTPQDTDDDLAPELVLSSQSTLLADTTAILVDLSTIFQDAYTIISVDITLISPADGSVSFAETASILIDAIMTLEASVSSLAELLTTDMLRCLHRIQINNLVHAKDIIQDSALMLGDTIAILWSYIRDQDCRSTGHPDAIERIVYTDRDEFCTCLDDERLSAAPGSGDISLNSHSDDTSVASEEAEFIAACCSE